MNVEIGKRYNNWKVIAEAGPELGKHKYICECICGTQRPVMKYNLGVVKGCGCDRAPYTKSGKYIGQKKSKPKNITINVRKLADKYCKPKPHQSFVINPKPQDYKNKIASEREKRRIFIRREAEHKRDLLRLEREYGELE